MFMTTDARVRSSWVTFEPSTGAPISSTPPTRCPSTEKDVADDEFADFTKEYGLHHERITLPTTFNAK